jgi:thiol-disulfide isomerase/thioredoxin
MAFLQVLQTSILSRSILALTIIVTGLGLYWLFNRVILLRAEKNNGNNGVLFPGITPGVPAILYFTTPTCAPCKTIQRPALQQLKNRLGDCIQVIEVDAAEKPDLANRWGVFSVPTTFIIDSTGKLRHVNHGVTRSDKLIEQISSIQ